MEKVHICQNRVTSKSCKIAEMCSLNLSKLHRIIRWLHINNDASVVIMSNWRSLSDLTAFHFRISHVAAKYLSSLRMKYESDSMLVGVHVRRTDQATWIKDMTGGGRLLRPSEILYLMGFARKWLMQRNQNGKVQKETLATYITK